MKYLLLLSTVFVFTACATFQKKAEDRRPSSAEATEIASIKALPYFKEVRYSARILISQFSQTAFNKNLSDAERSKRFAKILGDARALVAAQCLGKSICPYQVSALDFIAELENRVNPTKKDFEEAATFLKEEVRNSTLASHLL